MRFFWFTTLLLLTNTSFQSNLKIIKTRSGSQRPAPCATICAGETGPSPTFRDYYDGRVKFLVLDVDMTECGFVELPILNVHLEGDVTRIAQWTHASNILSRKSFVVYITSNTHDTKTFWDWNLNVMWTAIGYDC